LSVKREHFELCSGRERETGVREKGEGKVGTGTRERAETWRGGGKDGDRDRATRPGEWLWGRDRVGQEVRAIGARR
jgi:hypothetical protein